MGKKLTLQTVPAYPQPDVVGANLNNQSLKTKKRNPTRSAESYAIIGARDENRTRTGMNPEGF